MDSHFKRVPGSFCLPHAQTISLHPTQTGVLHVTGGWLWLTSNTRSGDYFLQPGDAFAAPNGAHLVLEAWGSKVKADAYFYWQPTG